MVVSLSTFKVQEETDNENQFIKVQEENYNEKQFHFVALSSNVVVSL